jgi:hypothetical protein
MRFGDALRRIFGTSLAFRLAACRDLCYPVDPESPGWTAEEAAEYDRLREALGVFAGAVSGP